MKQFRLVIVEWVDSRGIQSEWHLATELLKPCICRSVGYLLQDDEVSVIVAPHIATDKDEQVCGTMTIPRECIRSIKDVGHFEMTDEEIGQKIVNMVIESSLIRVEDEVIVWSATACEQIGRVVLDAMK